MSYKHISVPETGDMIVVNADNSLSVPDNPIIPYIEGDGIGVDISPVMIAVVDAAVAKAYDSGRQISWMEIYTGCLLYTSPSPRDVEESRMPSSA